MTEKRSSPQNRAMHKLFTDISRHCNERGIDQKTMINTFNHYETPVTPESVKETWRVIQYNMFNTHSTKHIEKEHVDMIYGVFNKFWSQLTGEHFPFPTVEDMIIEHEKNTPEEKESVNAANIIPTMMK